MEIGLLRLGGGAWGDAWIAPLGDGTGNREVTGYGYFGYLKILL